MLLLISLLMFLNEYNYKIKLLCILFAYFYKDQKKIFLPIRLKMETRAGKALSRPPPKKKTQSIKIMRMKHLSLNVLKARKGSKASRFNRHMILLPELLVLLSEWE